MIALLLLILWPVAELFVAIKVAEAIGIAFTIVLLIAGLPIGIWLTRSGGRAAWRRLSAATAAGRPPGREAVDGALALAGGVLIMIPGFISDGIGALLLLAPSRALARWALIRNFQSRVVVAATRFSRAPRSSYDVDSTATDLDSPQLHG
jgi:UPF0716 protein FxsA